MCRIPFEAACEQIELKRSLEDDVTSQPSVMLSDSSSSTVVSPARSIEDRRSMFDSEFDDQLGDVVYSPRKVS